MKKNIGLIDITIRIIIAVMILILIILKILTGIPSLITAIIAGVLILTSITGTCLLYLPFKFSTRKKD